MIASASADDYRKAIEALAGDPSVDAIVAIFIPPLVTQAQDVAEAVRAASEATRDAGKPLLAVWMAQDDAALATLAGGVGGVPAYGTPEEAVRALAHAAGYATWQQRRRGSHPTGLTASTPMPPRRRSPRCSPKAAAGSCPTASRSSSPPTACRRSPPRSRRRPPRWRAAPPSSPGDVAVKAIAPGLLHKSDVGGVRLGIRGGAAAGRAAREIAAAVREAGHQPVGYLVQSMAPEGVEMLVGVTSDPDWGPGGRVRRRRPRRRAARRRAVAAGAAQPPRRRRDAARRCAPSRCSTATAARRRPTWPRSRTSSCGSPRSPPRTPRSPSSTATRCSSDPRGATVVDARIRIAAPRPPRPYPSLDR